MSIDGPKIDRLACPAASAEDVQPRRSGDQRGPNRGRSQHVAAGCPSPVPAIDDELCLDAALSAFSLAAPALISSPRVLTPIEPVSGRQSEKSIRPKPSCGLPDPARGAQMVLAGVERSPAAPLTVCKQSQRVRD
jgi:hypothetical protein